MVHTDHGYERRIVAMSYRLTPPRATYKALQMTSRVAMPDMGFACNACFVGTAAVPR